MLLCYFRYMHFRCKLQAGKLLVVRYISIINQIKRLFCSRMDNSRHFENPFDDYPNHTSHIILNINTKEVIIHSVCK